MKYFLSFLVFPFLLIFLPVITQCQTGTSFNLNIENGLPSNHIYDIVTDKYGYLWIGTPNGLVRYNGYELKLFSLNTGLPYEDIWAIYPDKKDRLWLCNASNELGYIYNNKYHPTFLNNISGTIYPKEIRDGAEGIMFYSQYINSKSLQPTICLEKNDTITKYAINSSLFNESLQYDTLPNVQTSFNYNSEVTHLANVMNDEYGKSYILYDNNIYEASISNNKLLVHKLYRLPDDFTTYQFAENVDLTADNYLISYPRSGDGDKFFALKLSDGRLQNIELLSAGQKERIAYIYPGKVKKNNQYFYVFTTDSIHKFSDRPEIKHIASYSIKKLTGLTQDIDGSRIRTFYADSLWGNSIGTTTKGLWINYNFINHFNKVDIDFLNYQYIGNGSDEMNFWWNPLKKMLAEVHRDYKISYHNYKNIVDLNSITNYNDDTFLLSGTQAYLLVDKTGELIQLDRKKFGQGIYSVIIDSPNSSISATTIGFFCTRHINDSFVRHYINTERYRGLLYDSFRKMIWAYNNDKITIHFENKDTLLLKANVPNLKKQKIEKIVIDNKYGNIFIKGQSNILLYDYELNKSTEIFRNFNLAQSSLYVSDNKLIVAGRYGIIFCNLTGRGQLSAPVVYTNLKNENYNAIYDCQVSFGDVLLSTDKGTFLVHMPSDSEIRYNKQPNFINQYKFILSYRDNVTSLKNEDTLIIDQKDYKLQFDVTNPYGNGAVKYRYKLSTDSDWHELNANELSLPNLSPDKYYKLSVIASDNVWRSNQLELNVYIQPYWWQTKNGRRLTWLSAIIFIVVLFSISVLLTRKLVLRATQKRNLQMELELKSIYAQINPHFIFNSLNSALLLVSKNKMEEAYSHISKFSRLLRSYIKSSRNKLITIAEEINNLRNYIELQQTRFKNKLEYQIIVDKALAPENIKIPSLLLQPFVENAINHGILNKNSKGHLKIEFKYFRKENEIICTIEDDGIGRRQSKFINRNKPNKEESYGNLLIKDLITIFNNYENMNIDIRYTDIKPPLSGTIVTIQIKNPHYA